MTLRTVVDRLFGVRTRCEPVTVQISLPNVANEALPNDPSRLAYLLVNVGSTDLYAGWDRDASSTKGILLVPYGGSLAVTVEEDFELPAYALYVHPGSGTGTVFVLLVKEL